MKVLALNGSPRPKGNTTLALAQMREVFEREQIELEEIRVGHLDLRGCIACERCRKLGKCTFDDAVNEVAEKLAEADGLILASPVYYASANSTLTALCDRLFYSYAGDLRFKVGASVVVARRAGTSSTIDQLNKYFTISGMPVASSYYWNGVHGAKPGQLAEDLEGISTLRELANNMSFLLKAIGLAKEQLGLPESEPHSWTNFVR